eukprot:8614360-Pyramimonas_sp.AAC.1
MAIIHDAGSGLQLGHDAAGAVGEGRRRDDISTNARKGRGHGHAPAVESLDEIHKRHRLSIAYLLQPVLGPTESITDGASRTSAGLRQLTDGDARVKATRWHAATQ